MDRDLGHVRLHTDPAAAAASEQLGARAFTVGPHVFVGRGWSPGTSDGDRLLAHELVHVRQQTDGPARDGGGLEVRERAPQKVQGSWIGDTWDQVTGARRRQFGSDLVASVREAPSHALGVLGEVWDAIREHWVAFSVTLVAILTVEAVIAALAGAPEPTTVPKRVAAALQSSCCSCWASSWPWSSCRPCSVEVDGWIGRGERRATPRWSRPPPWRSATCSCTWPG